MMPYYKKNLDLFVEYYLSNKDNRNKVKEIAEREKSQSQSQGQGQIKTQIKIHRLKWMDKIKPKIQKKEKR